MQQVGVSTRPKRLQESTCGKFSNKANKLSRKTVIRIQQTTMTMMPQTLLCALVLIVSSCALLILAEDKICNAYVPRTKVRDELLLDLDLQDIWERLELGQLVHARKVFLEGGHSMPVADITLLDPPAAFTYPEGTVVNGLTSVDSREVSGFLHKSVRWLDGHRNESIVVRYAIPEAGDESLLCSVGGLYTFSGATLEGCFQATGTLELVEPSAGTGSGELFPYRYDIRQDNRNLRTYHGFGVHAASRSRDCHGCPFHPEFQKFVDFYGDEEYGNRWIMAASTGNKTSFSSSNGDADFGSQTALGRAEGFFHGILVFNVLMQVIVELEESVSRCNEFCSGEKCLGDGHINSLDKAASFFCGSLADEGDDGVLLYSLAQTRHNEFHPKSSPQVPLGDHLVKIFQEAQDSSLRGDCDAIAQYKQFIVDKMKVPLVQSVLRYAYVRENHVFSDDLEREKALSFGATYLAGLLPFVHACSESSAAVLYDELHFGSDTKPSFERVKTTLESQYVCLRISCEEVGGLLLNDEDYARGGAPCLSNAHRASDEENQKIIERAAGIILGITLTFVAIASITVFVLKRRATKVNRRRHFHSAGSNIAAASDLA